MSEPVLRTPSCPISWCLDSATFSSCRIQSIGSSRSRSPWNMEAISPAGHFKPIRSPKFLNGCQEFVFHFTKTGRVKIDRLSIGVPYQHKSNIKRWNHTQGRTDGVVAMHGLSPTRRFTVGISSGLTRPRFRWNWRKIASVFTALAEQTVALDPFLGPWQLGNRRPKLWDSHLYRLRDR